MADETTKEKVEEKLWIHKLYLGKELKKTDAKNEPPKWKLFKLKFDTGGEYLFTCDAFDTIGTKEDSKSITLKELEEGKWYTVGINVVKEAFEAHGKWHDNRTAFYLKETTEEDAVKNNQKQQTAPKQERPPTTPTGTHPLTKIETDSLFNKLKNFDKEFQILLTAEGREDDYNLEQFMSSAYLSLHEYEALGVMAFWNAYNNISSVDEEEKETEKKEKQEVKEDQEEKDQLNKEMKEAIEKQSLKEETVEE